MFCTTLYIVYTSIVLKQNGKNNKIQKYQCKTRQKLKNDSQHKCKVRIVIRLEPKEYTNPLLSISRYPTGSPSSVTQ